MRYVAIEADYTRIEISELQQSGRRINIKWKVIGIGDDLDSEPIKALKDKIETRFHHAYGHGKSYDYHINKVKYWTVQETMRRIPYLRERLKHYDMKYYEWRESVDERKRIAESKKKVGVRFVEYAE